MKKTVLTAAFAALALSAAQAVNISWQQDSVTGNQTIGSFGDGSVFALTATLTVPSANGQDLFRFGAGTGDSANYIKVAKNLVNNMGTLKFWAKGAGGNEDSAATSLSVSPTDYAISLVVDQREGASKVTLYANGTKVGELTLTCGERRRRRRRGGGRGRRGCRAGWWRRRRARGAGGCP